MIRIKMTFFYEYFSNIGKEDSMSANDYILVQVQLLKRENTAFFQNLEFGISSYDLSDSVALMGGGSLEACP